MFLDYAYTHKKCLVAMTNSSKDRSSGIKSVSPANKPWLVVIFSVSGLLLLVSLLDYDPENYHSSPATGDPPLLGMMGLYLARFFFSLFGISAWLLPWLLGNLAFLFASKSTFGNKARKSGATILCIVSLCILANLRDFTLAKTGNDTLFDPNFLEHGAGGSLGALFYSGLPFSSSHQGVVEFGGFLRVWMGELGTSALTLIVLISSIWVHFSQSSILRILNLVRKRFLIKNQPEFSSFESTAQRDSSTSLFSFSRLVKKVKLPFFTTEPEDDLLFGDVSLQKDKESSKDLKTSNQIKTAINTKNKTSTIAVKVLESNQDEEEEAKDEQVHLSDEFLNPSSTEKSERSQHDSSTTSMDGFKVVRAAKTEKASDLFPERKGDYHFPTLDLLMDIPEEETSGDEDHMLKARRLKETLSEFKIEIVLGEVHTGPVITRYDVHPAPGVRVEKIANLDKNLAMALKADSVRILAPVPGKGCVGIEVPNEKPAAVCLKEILQSRAWANAGSEIPIVLGKEASGLPLVADLTKMPHLLVAGSTGSGKTVCINAIIASLCYHSSPEDLRFIMVDPKIVEMKVYNDLPHMLIPVVTEPKKVPGALKWLLVEMERRYQIFSKVGVRNIAGFNAKILKDKEEKEKARILDEQMTAEERSALSSVQVPRDDSALEIPENKLPYIVCIIDELADLMMVAQADVETGIARLAQLARAAGIHLIIATQRPSVNVITGVIKANLPSRISFRVASYRDSQTILDGKGAESLIGRGDMLFIPPGSSSFSRAQGAFVSDEEINGIVDYLKVNGPPQIIEEVREQIESAGEDDVLGESEGDSDEDPMARKAIEIIRSTKRASTSNLQRKLSIGYNRAARIMDDLEDRGLVGPDIPGQGREILMDL